MPDAIFLIKNPTTKFVIDIAQNPAQSGRVDAFTLNNPPSGSSNQLWTFVPFNKLSYVNYYFLQNPQTDLVIEIEGPGVSSDGTLKGPLTHPAKLLAKPIKGPGSTGAIGEGEPANWNQLWGLLPVPAESGQYWIVNPTSGFAIDIAEGEHPLSAVTAGALLDAYPQKKSTPQNSNQLWTFMDQSGNPLTHLKGPAARVIPHTPPPPPGNPVQK
jgi:hypothetical protein